MTSDTFNTSELDSKKLHDLALRIKDGAIAILPTDTIYGIVTSALKPKSVEKVYKLRKRTSSKPMIVLIESEKQISHFAINLTERDKDILSDLWPNPISVVINCSSKDFHYLHRGKNSIAFRVPKNEFIQKILKFSGPIVAPSANFEGEESAENIEQAKNYFKDSVSFYLDQGELKSKPSTVVKLEDSKLVLLREGAAKIPKNLLK